MLPTSRPLAALCLSALLLGATAGPAAAQPQPGPPGTTTAADLDTRPVDEALEAYWGEKPERDAVVHETFDREFRHELTLFHGFIPNDPFNSYYPLGARYDFYFLDWLGLEAWGGYLIRVGSDLNDFLSQNFNDSLLEDIPPSLQWFAGLNLMFSPIHGKFAIFDQKLTHFDAFFTLGGGPIGYEVTDDGVTSSEVGFAGNFGVGFRMRFLDFLGFRMEYRQHFYNATGGATAFPSEIALGLSFWL